MITSLLQHPLWPRIRPFVRLQARKQDGGHRLEVATPSEAEAVMWIALTVPCPHCRQMMHPIRDRTPAHRTTEPRHLYLAASCPAEQKPQCCRSGEAHREIDRLRADVAGWSAQQQPALTFPE